MRILHVTPTYLPAVRYGGPIFAVHGLCRALAYRGHVVEVFTTNVNGSENSPVPTGVQVDIDGVQVTYFCSQLLRRLYWAPSLDAKLRQKINKFDLVHLHSVFLWPTWRGALAARRARVPYVVSPSGMLVKDLIKRRSRLAKSSWINFIERANIENSAALHAASQVEAEELYRFDWRLPPVAVIPYGVEDPESLATGDISQDIKDIVDGQPLVLYLGRLSWIKGLDRLLKAFALTSHGKLAIVGTDDEHRVSSLMALAQGLRISDRVCFLPRTVSGRDKEYLFMAAQALALPSYSESFGVVVLEAMRRGIPVVTTPQVGAAEIVCNARGGLVVDGDPASLGEAINSLINNSVLSDSMGKRGQRYVLEHHTWSHAASQIEALYEGLMA